MFRVLWFDEFFGERDVWLESVVTGEEYKCFDPEVGGRVGQCFDFMDEGEVYDCWMELNGSVVEPTDPDGVECEVLAIDVLLGHRKFGRVLFRGDVFYVGAKLIDGFSVGDRIWLKKHRLVLFRVGDVGLGGLSNVIPGGSTNDGFSAVLVDADGRRPVPELPVFKVLNMRKGLSPSTGRERSEWVRAQSVDSGVCIEGPADPEQVGFYRFPVVNVGDEFRFAVELVGEVVDVASSDSWRCEIIQRRQVIGMGVFCRVRTDYGVFFIESYRLPVMRVGTVVSFDVEAFHFLEGYPAELEGHPVER